MTKNIKQTLKEKSNDYSALESEFFKKTGKSIISDHCSVIPTKNESLLSASIVIPAWNAKETILSCLIAIEQNSFNNKYPEKLQVVVVDDGSTDNTLKILKESSLNINLTIVHQDNQGQGQAMNAGISVAEGDIIIEVDADTILNYYAVENIMARHQFHKNALYTGFRNYVEEDDIRVSIEYLRKEGPDSGFHIVDDERVKFPTGGWPSNMCLASNHYKNLGNSNGLWMGNDDNDDPWILADMVFGMFFSLPRELINRVGGFDDRFEGWGCDDGYVGAKVIAERTFIIPVYTATGFHISHPFRTEDIQEEYDFNRKFFFEFINETNYKEHPDWISKAASRIKGKFIKTNNIESHSPTSSDKSITQPMTTKQLLSIGKYAEAYEILSKQDDKNDMHFLHLGKVLLGLEKYEECISLLENRCKDTKNSDLLFNLSRAYSSIGSFLKAYDILEKISKLNPKYPELEYWLYRDPKASLRQGIKYYNQRFYSVAKVCFEAVLISDRNNVKARSYYEKCLLQKKK